MGAVYDHTLKTIDGNDQALLDFEGKVLLIVNVASKCGLTPQYEGLQALHQRLQSRGFEILGFPCNQFGKQEPGTDAEVKTFCATNYAVSFPMFSKIEVNGPTRHDLYELLSAVNTEPEGEGDIQWNFTKFVIDRQGQVIGRFEPKTEADDALLVARIENAL